MVRRNTVVDMFFKQDPMLPLDDVPVLGENCAAGCDFSFISLICFVSGAVFLCRVDYALYVSLSDWCCHILVCRFP